MIPRISDRLCTGCGECVEVCPTEALTASIPPRVLGGLCVSCGACVRACGPGAVRFPRHPAPVTSI